MNEQKDVDPHFTDMTGVVLAGGKSRRMGRDKRFLDVGGATLLERVSSVVGPLFPERLLSVAEPSPELAKMSYRLVVDLIRESAALGGLYTALSEASHPRIFVVGCDMPFISDASIHRVVELSGDYDVVMVELATGLQPMHAIYSKNCLPFMQRLIRDRDLRIQLLAQAGDLKVKILKEQEVAGSPEQLLSFFNINTPADLELAKKLCGSGPSGA